jgi:hypothetical protein
MSKDEVIPPTILRFAEKLYQHTDVQPTITHTDRGWFVEHRNERAVLTRLYRTTSQGLIGTENTLTVNGERHPLVSGYCNYAAVFLGHDVPMDPHDHSAEYEELIPLGETEFVPSIVRSTYSSVVRSFMKKNGSADNVSVGRISYLYVIEVKTPKGVLRLWYRKSRGKWGPDRWNPMTVVDHEGRDITNKLGRDLESIMSALLGSDPGASGGIPIGRPRQAQGGLSSVDVRKNTVIRV